ncbi:L-seryl-tRNA(Sec) selenium transferase [Taurinivorans muris]|uniref:L-seryl-tRNA(Sec) selenium transferase n=1 Tax=Taurinivorans muris TaxID=2787751 RepID=A0ABY5Y289_9BACT|nr:L-seryl-tRNA(Sec) selenium transferase [Desulfovibrionaceae bacterium LT0009]
MSNLYRLLPSVDICLRQFRDTMYPHALLCDAVNAFLSEKRGQIKDNLIKAEDLKEEKLFSALKEYVCYALSPRVKKVINASGVVIHTNLGRSVLAKEALDAVNLAASGYCNLEFDLEKGERGSRHTLVEKDICKLTGAEAALVVNNNASAVYLVLNSLCFGGEVIVSRGELVEIGGSFRIPEVMKQSGTALHEVGTTNKTHLKDYQDAFSENTKAVLKVHTSNYRIIGFQADVPNHELAEFAHSRNIPLIHDLGSGSLIDLSAFGLRNEPTVKGIVASGIDIVTFSGDKVLGGPQAGIIAGKKEYIDRIKKNQMLRALRCDKLTLSALSATLRLYYDEKLAFEKIPTLNALTASKDILKKKAKRLHNMLKGIMPKEKVKLTVEENISRVGGGAFPETDLPTYAVCVEFLEKNSAFSAKAWKERFLKTDPPIVGRVERDKFLFDVRTIANEEFILIRNCILSIL